MSRSVTPPDTLSKTDIRTLADIRRDIWTNSFYGMGYGGITGLAGHSILSYVVSRNIVPYTPLKNMKLNRNTATFSILVCASLGSFLAASVTGKNQVHHLHPIFEVGAVKRELQDDGKTELTEYQKKLRKAQEEEFKEKRLKNRLLRRKTLRASLESRGGGGGTIMNPSPNTNTGNNNNNTTTNRNEKWFNG